MEKLRDMDPKIMAPITGVIVIIALFLVLRSAGVGVAEPPPNVPPIAASAGPVDLAKMGVTGSKKQTGSPALLR
jgi:hypothetical protein